jgi:biotin carboxyl carrier protein
MGISHTQHEAAPAVAQPLSRDTQFDTCTIANAIEHFKVRLRNEGFTRPGLRCVTGVSVARIFPGTIAEGRSDRAMRTFMRNLVSKPYHVLHILAAALLASSCAQREAVHASVDKPADAPTVAVAKASTQDLSHGLVLTAEFTPYQEVDVMAKVAGFVKQINVDVGDRVNEGQLLV